MARTPRIGIGTYGVDRTGRFTLPAGYVECVRRAGGLPLLLAPGETRAGEWLELVDALLLAGGGDVDPALYGGRAHPSIGGVDRARDTSEIELVHGAIARGTPLLAICRGLQLLNVALGGTLIEHLPDEVGETVPHRSKRDYACHAVAVERDSRLAGILGTTEPNPASSHHQALRRVAVGLAVVARAADGVVEAAEMPARCFLVGVQWHPERTAALDAGQQRLFDALVAAAR